MRAIARNRESSQSAAMSDKVRYYVGDDPHGYGGVEVSAEQARAYAEAIATEASALFPQLEILVGIPDGFMVGPAHFAAHGWVQANWRRVRVRVNQERGWEEQFGGALWVSPRE